MLMVSNGGPSSTSCHDRRKGARVSSATGASRRSENGRDERRAARCEQGPEWRRTGAGGGLRELRLFRNNDTTVHLGLSRRPRRGTPCSDGLVRILRLAHEQNRDALSNWPPGATRSFLSMCPCAPRRRAGEAQPEGRAVAPVAAVGVRHRQEVRGAGGRERHDPPPAAHQGARPAQRRRPARRGAGHPRPRLSRDHEVDLRPVHHPPPPGGLRPLQRHAGRGRGADALTSAVDGHRAGPIRGRGRCCLRRWPWRHRAGAFAQLELPGICRLGTRRRHARHVDPDQGVPDRAGQEGAHASGAVVPAVVLVVDGRRGRGPLRFAPGVLADLLRTC